MSVTLLQYYADRASAIAARAFDGIRTLEDWQRERPILRRHFLHSLGLERLPEDQDPRIRDHGALRGRGYTARKVSYQIVPDCYGSGIVFFPDPLPAAKNPAVLYLCGHGNLGVLEFHPHAIMWARRGYVCLIIDTIRQTDNTGDHSGLLSSGREDWISMGYTSAGGELLNSWGGLNVLCSLPEVDTRLIGATGQSGGGAHSFFLAIADERIGSVASSCGVVSLGYTIRNRHYNDNCDCMSVYNLYQKDTAEYGALIAPRPLLLAHARGDYLFTPPENRALHAGISRIYSLFGCPESCVLFPYDGPHSYQPSSVKAINGWFDLHLGGGTRGGDGGAGLPLPELDEKQCTIFNGNWPVPDRLDILPELLTPPRSFSLPDSLEELAALRAEVLRDLEERVFHYVMTSDEKLQLEQIHEWRLDPERPFPVMRKYRGTIGGMELWITHHRHGPGAKNLLVCVCGRDDDSGSMLATLPLETSGIDLMTVEPRAAGLNAPGSEWKVSLMRAGMYLGVTPVTLWIKDLREVLAHFRAAGEIPDQNVYLFGKRDAGTAALYATLMDESIRGVIIGDIWRSHKVGGHIPNILKVMDVEQALGLLAPRVIGLDTHEWEFVFWSARLYQRLGIWDRFVHTHSMDQTLRRIFHPERP